MAISAPPRYTLALLGIATGIASVVGAIMLIWGSEDAMLVVIHWLGEERALGPQNVIVQPNGSKLLTNPGAMARWVMLIWTVGLSQLIAGLHLLWSSSMRFRGHAKRLG
jgi:hypothetical protein